VTQTGVAERVAELLNALSRDLLALQEVGGAIPAVERNVVRMRGTLHALRVQFGDLAPSGEREG
jgi:hypothetical protein